ncbi:hypothetical protein VE03_00990 [Pseudogymnoascus sp. 23342-1-I1]|nr:hypothetical protein VE03_00990 [Pseudogymnoascus sp. 23342-1-I1]
MSVGISDAKSHILLSPSTLPAPFVFTSFLHTPTERSATQIGKKMRLFHAETKQFEEFWDQIPPYAILSHTWGSNEPSFKDVEQNGYTASLKTDGCCKQALQDGLKYVWIDTFCIDKSSSAELSEAINSMWAWYERAEVCYAYLSDVPPGTSIYDDDSAFCKSRWFTRGWTLQELLAPSKVVLYDESWGRIGQKASSMEFTRLLARVTRIPFDTLLFKKKLHTNSVAQKMSWISHRNTTRLEDNAYSLLGLFGIHMPLLYGEGAQAFKRLQEEIIKISDDESIFAWGFQRPPGQNASLFAVSPLDFENCGSIKASAPAAGMSAHYILTNKGLSIKTNLYRLPLQGEIVTLARLNCSEPSWVEEEKCLALVMEDQSPENHVILTRRCEVAPLLVPSKLFSTSHSTRVYVHRSMGHWLDETRSGLQIQCWLFGKKATYNIREFYPPAWRSILTSNSVMWFERKGLISKHQSIVFLVEDANRPNYVVSVDYTFRPNHGNLAPRELKFCAAFVEKDITLAEEINRVGADLDWQDALDFGDSELRMHLSKKRELGAHTWIMHIDIEDKKRLPTREKTTEPTIPKVFH